MFRPFVRRSTVKRGSMHFPVRLCANGLERVGVGVLVGVFWPYCCRSARNTEHLGIYVHSGCGLDMNGLHKGNHSECQRRRVLQDETTLSRHYSTAQLYYRYRDV